MGGWSTCANVRTLHLIKRGLANLLLLFLDLFFIKIICWGIGNTQKASMVPYISEVFPVYPKCKITQAMNSLYNFHSNFLVGDSAKVRGFGHFFLLQFHFLERRPTTRIRTSIKFNFAIVLGGGA